MSTIKANTWLNSDELRDIDGYNKDYKVDSYGNIYSFKYGKIRKLKASINKKGYISYKLTKNSIGKSFTGHRLVATAFIENPNKLEQVNHKNGIKTDNRVENLEWCNAKQNKTHAIENNLFSISGLSNAYKSGGRASLSIEDTLKIKELKSKGMSNRSIAKILNYNRATIDRFLNGKSIYLKGGTLACHH